MDIPKKANKRRKLLMPIMLIMGLFVFILAWKLTSLADNSNSTAKSSLIIAQVIRGDIVREVRATGTLVPVDLRWLSARVMGRIEQIKVEAGAHVLSDTLIMEMSNPTLAQNVDNARIELEVLKAQADVLEMRLISNLLSQQSVVADFVAQYENARIRMEANQSLGQLAPKIDTEEAILLEAQFKIRLRIERQRLAHLEQLNAAELRANVAEMNRAYRQLQLQEELLDGLKIRAGLNGVLQDIPIEIGQEIRAGELLARVAGEDNLKAELRVQESQIAGVRVGQFVVISAAGNETEGRVSRIDPSVQNGVVLVDVTFNGARLNGARPDLRIEGTIELEAAENTLVLPRPVFTQENTSAELFIINESENKAYRINVSLGIASVDQIQVVNGLEEGDSIILSDTSQLIDVSEIVLTE